LEIFKDFIGSAFRPVFWRNENMEKKTMPVYVVKLGKVQASIWRNETKHGPPVQCDRVPVVFGEWGMETVGQFRAR
jgi:hypothetical protein